MTMRSFCALLLVAITAGAGETRSIRVDAARVTGTIRSFQGVNLGPCPSQRGFPDLSAQYREMRVDLIRTHDFFGPTDIDSRPKDRGHDQVIFPDWAAAHAKEESYRFAPSDRLMKGIVDCGAQPYFRLGRSYFANPTPPPDFDKFAEVSRHVAMHYNAGWANGFHYGIKYWEVWNEPNIETNWVPSKGLNLFWSGSREQFFDLYARTARALKTLDPSLKVGGPGLAEGARESPWREGFVRFCAANHVPLDFLSWHHYHGDSYDPWDMVRIGQDVRRLLDQNGLRHTESHVNEWNLNLTKGRTGPQHQASMESAAFTACALAYLQDSPVDLSFYYTGNAGSMGSFETNGVARKKAFALRATGAMLATPQRLKVRGADTEGFAVLAGRAPDGRSVQVLISNYQIQQPQEPPHQSAPPGSHGLARRKLHARSVEGYSLSMINLPWGDRSCTIKRYRTDAEHDFALVEETKASGGKLDLHQALPAPGIELLIVTANEREWRQNH